MFGSWTGKMDPRELLNAASRITHRKSFAFVYQATMPRIVMARTPSTRYHTATAVSLSPRRSIDSNPTSVEVNTDGSQETLRRRDGTELAVGGIADDTISYRRG